MFNNFIFIFSAYLPFIVIVFCMYIADTITGVSKALILHKYESNRARKGFSKLLTGVILLLCCILLEILLLYIDIEFKLTIIIALAMSIVELTSIAENFEEITGKNFITDTIKIITSMIKKTIENKIGKDENNGK